VVAGAGDGTDVHALGTDDRLLPKHDDRAGRLSVIFRPGARSLPRPCTARAEAMADRPQTRRSGAQPAPQLGRRLPPVWPAGPLPPVLAQRCILGQKGQAPEDWEAR
jgi:hypothetical protein